MGELALELQPNSVVALNGLVTLDVVEKRPDAARATLESRLASAPNDEALLFLAGNVYLTIGDAQRAESLFQKVLQLDPANFDAVYNAGTTLARDGKIAAARPYLELFLKTAPPAFYAKDLKEVEALLRR